MISLKHIENNVLSREGTLACDKSSSDTVFPRARDYGLMCVFNDRKYILSGCVDGHVEDFGCLQHFVRCPVR